MKLSLIKETLRIRALGLWKIPVLFFVGPTVIELDEDRCVIKIPLGYRTKNHLGSMYFGVLAAGADCAGGLIAWKLIEENGSKLTLIFKDFHAEFLKRADGDVHFVCEDGPSVKKVIDQALRSGERENVAVHVVATVPSRYQREPVAKFKLTLSLKRRK